MFTHLLSNGVIMIFDLKFLSECFDVNFLTGEVRWKMTRPQEHFNTWRGWVNWHNKNPGKVAGYIDANGYKALKLTIDGKEYNVKQHHVVFALYHEDPGHHMLDHWDGNPLNNSISNLRPTNHEKNARNRKVSVKNTSGITGVRKVKDRKNLWVATVIVDGKTLTKTSADFFEVCCFRKSWENKLSLRIRT